MWYAFVDGEGNAHYIHCANVVLISVTEGIIYLRQGPVTHIGVTTETALNMAQKFATFKG